MRKLFVDCMALHECGHEFDCCGSCHNEWEGDYSQPLEIYKEVIINDMDLEFQFFICCYGSDVVKGLKAKDYKKILEFKEKKE